MDTVLNKRNMTEEDIKLKFITPSILKKWDKSKITMETKITDGKINIKGNKAVREKPKKVDYLLYLSNNNPIAVVEAKDNNHNASHGLQQAQGYAKMLDLPFAYSSNGDEFYEYDFLLGKVRNFPMDKFPTEEELIKRFKEESNNGNGLSDKEVELIKQPYFSDVNSYGPRYYQRIAINRTLRAIANGQKRLLLVMATGVGKTYTAFQIVYKLLASNSVNKVLYLADRNALIDQTISGDFKPLEKVCHKINVAKDKKEAVTSYKVYFSLYQQLVGDDDVEHYSEMFPNPNFFDLVIVDECHRGSAKEESRWRRILEYFSSSIQLRMTATPNETKYVSNINYFGEPIYQYSLNNGIEDGFLAPFKVYNILTNIGDGWRPTYGQKDKYGNKIEDRIYTNSDYDYNIVIEDRTIEVAKEITKYLKATDRMAKTIVFCPTEEAADRMKNALINLNSDMCQKNSDYVVRITASDMYGKGKIKEFSSVSEPYPTIATTSDLLSTGVDTKMVKLIVLDETISSMTKFKQIIGRGTRIREKEGKLSFAVMDFRGVSRLFADPKWDGPIEMIDGFEPQPIQASEKPTHPYSVSNEKPVVDAEGCKVEIIHKVVSVYDANGKLLKYENIIDYTKHNIKGEFASLDAFIKGWSAEEKKVDIIKALREKGIDLAELKKEADMEDVDDFDFICHIAYNKKPLSRKERAEMVMKTDFISRYNGIAKEVLELLLNTYMNSSIYEIEDTIILRVAPFNKYGTPSRIIKQFGGLDKYKEAVHQLTEELYKVG